jgi:hypothetical protein
LNTTLTGTNRKVIVGNITVEAGNESDFGKFLTGWSDEVEGSGPKKHIWTTATTAEVLVVTPGQLANARLRLTGIPFLIPGIVMHQEIWVFINGLFACFGALSSPGNLVGGIPKSATRGISEILTISIVVPRAVIPSELGIGQDQRRLGFALESMEISW